MFYYVENKNDSGVGKFFFVKGDNNALSCRK